MELTDVKIKVPIGMRNYIDLGMQLRDIMIYFECRFQTFLLMFVGIHIVVIRQEQE